MPPPLGILPCSLSFSLLSVTTVSFRYPSVSSSCHNALQSLWLLSTFPHQPISSLVQALCGIFSLTLPPHTE